MVLTVRDTGVGIAADLLPHVFDVFVQGSITIDRSQGGLGIGLALVRRLVELHGGSVSAQSDGAGEGSVFEIRLPRAAAVVVAVPCAQAGVDSGKPTVLLIEDNEDGREMMATMLGAYGYSVQQAADGVQGVQMAHAGAPDVALVDIGLPGIDGYEVARRLRKDDATRHIKLIALTGYGLADDQKRVMEAGFDVHLVKPVDINHLLEAIGSFSPAVAAAASKRLSVDENGVLAGPHFFRLLPDCELHRRGQFVLAHRHLAAQRFHVELGFLRHREHFPFFFADVMVDLLAQYLHLGVVQVIFRIHLLDLRDEVLGAGMLDFRFVEQVGRFLAGGAQGWIENFFFDRGVQRQRSADLVGQFFLAGLGAVAQFIILLEHRLHFLVIGGQHRNGINWFGGHEGSLDLLDSGEMPSPHDRCRNCNCRFATSHTRVRTAYPKPGDRRAKAVV